MNDRLRTALLIVDAVALLGLVVFSVMGALHRDSRLYVVGQIISAAIVLGSVVLLHRLRAR